MNEVSCGLIYVFLTTDRYSTPAGEAGRCVDMFLPLSGNVHHLHSPQQLLNYFSLIVSFHYDLFPPMYFFLFCYCVPQALTCRAQGLFLNNAPR